MLFRSNIDLSTYQCVDISPIDKYKKFKLSVNDILVALTGAQVGKVGRMPYSKQDFYLNQRVGKFVPNKDFIQNNRYMLTFVNSNKFLTQVQNIASGAAQPNISTFQIENIKMLIASSDIIALFEEKVDSLDKEINLLNIKNMCLKKTRDILLPRLVSGEIDVEGMEIA